MPFRINHIHIKAPDPRKTAEWWVRAFGFKIVSDETRIFGDRFVRCQTEDGGMMVVISNARTNETLGPGNAFAHFGLEHLPSTLRTLMPTSLGYRSSARGSKKGRSRHPTEYGSRS